MRRLEDASVGTYSPVMSAYPQTYNTLRDVFPRDLADIAIDYFGPRNGSRPGFHGAYERCATNQSSSTFLDACRAGHLEIVHLGVGQSVTPIQLLNSGLVVAAEAGHMDVVMTMCANGASDRDMAMVVAARAGHLEVCAFAAGQYQGVSGYRSYPTRHDISFAAHLLSRHSHYDATDVALAMACMGGHGHITEYIVDNMSPKYCLCGRSMAWHGHDLTSEEDDAQSDARFVERDSRGNIPAANIVTGISGPTGDWLPMAGGTMTGAIDMGTGNTRIANTITIGSSSLAYVEPGIAIGSAALYPSSYQPSGHLNLSNVATFDGTSGRIIRDDSHTIGIPTFSNITGRLITGG